jgi:hypothetical protein
LFESFKEDVTTPVIPVTVYADTFRRQLIDTAGKIVRHAGKLIMKVPRATFERLQFDRLFAAMKFMSDGAERQVIIDQLVDIVRTDAPWIWGFFPKSFSLHQQWLKNVYPNQMANNTLKYRRIDPVLRQQLRRAWNQPIFWPLGLAILLLLLVITPAWWLLRQRERKAAL